MSLHQTLQHCQRASRGYRLTMLCAAKEAFELLRSICCKLRSPIHTIDAIDGRSNGGNGSGNCHAWSDAVGAVGAASEPDNALSPLGCLGSVHIDGNRKAAELAVHVCCSGSNCCSLLGSMLVLPSQCHCCFCFLCTARCHVKNMMTS